MYAFTFRILGSDLKIRIVSSRALLLIGKESRHLTAGAGV